jgi:hypothetical protein
MAAPFPIACLPPPLVPVDTRLRCREVCRGWRGALDDARVHRVCNDDVTHRCWTVANAEAALLAAPALRELELNLTRAPLEALRLREGAPLAALRVRELFLCQDHGAPPNGNLLHVAAAVAAHGSLTNLGVTGVHLLPPVDAAFVSAALARRLTTVRLWGCGLVPGSAPALARLLGSDALTTLDIANEHEQLLDEEAAGVVGAALRANSTLTCLRLAKCGLSLDDDDGAATALMGALAGHASLRTLRVTSDGGNQPVAHALAPLVAANAPALVELDVSHNDLGDAAMRPLLVALSHNTHLRVLHCKGNALSDAFVRSSLARAVRARRIECDAVPGRVPAQRR